jgi:uncharacterized protein (TIGR00369 family)
MTKKKTTRTKSPVSIPPGMKIGLPRELGMRIVSISRKKVVAEMAVKSKHVTRWGYVHGGGVMAFGDAVGASGTIVNLEPGQRTVTIESKTNFFSAALPPLLRAVSVPLHIGRRTMVWQTTISNADGTRAAIVTQTQIVLPPEKPREATKPAKSKPATKGKAGKRA